MADKCEMIRMRDLINILNIYTEAYDRGEPIISDREWDDLYFKLVKMENETGLYYEDSPTQKIHFKEVSKLDKVTHSHPMLSLAKTKEILPQLNGKTLRSYSWSGLVTNSRI